MNKILTKSKISKISANSKRILKKEVKIINAWADLQCCGESSEDVSDWPILTWGYSVSVAVL